MEIDLYTFAPFLVGFLLGCIAGVSLSGLISKHKIERIEHKIHALSDSKFQLKGQRVRLKQLEQRLDEEAASIPLAERELLDKTGEIRELTTALTETTALTGELAEALRSRKLKVKQLQVEQSKWIQRNKALLQKTEQVNKKVSGIEKTLASQRAASEKLERRLARQTTPQAEEKNPVQSAAEAFIGQATAASPALAAGHHPSGDATNDESVDRLRSRMQEMENELQNWFDRVGKLEQGVTEQQARTSGLAMLEEVLRGEANKQAGTRDDNLKLLGGRSAS